MNAVRVAGLPIAVGGVGGSGTRLVAKILQDVGIHIGSELNGSLDNAWFTLLFKHAGILDIDDSAFEQRMDIFQSAMTGAPQLRADDLATVRSVAMADRLAGDSRWLLSKIEALIADRPTSYSDRAWGWKEPNTHIVLDRLLNHYPDLRYIHVTRNGLDMAYSSNQSQLSLWGEVALGEPVETTPRYSLRYWCWAHERVLRTAAKMPGRFKLLKFEDFCLNPKESLRELMSFLGVEADADCLRRLASLIKVPDTIGRHRLHPIDDFDAQDVARFRALDLYASR